MNVNCFPASLENNLEMPILKTKYLPYDPIISLLIT